MKLIFRLDDICPQMDKKKFERMRDFFLANDIKPIIGVVPECKDAKLNIDEADSEFWNEILSLQKKGWTVAMHGCYHKYTTSKKGFYSHQRLSEFAGLPLKEQEELIKTGKDILAKHGIDTDVFMAPSHSFDNNTLKALADNGFKYITDGYTRRLFRRKNLIFIPCMDPKIRKCRGISTVCYHTNFTTEKRYKEMEKFVSECKENITDMRSCIEENTVCGMGLRIKTEEFFNFYIRYNAEKMAYYVYKKLRKAE